MFQRLVYTHETHRYTRLPGSSSDPRQTHTIDRTALRARPSAPTLAPWARSKLAKWNNPVYPAAQPSIPSAHVDQESVRAGEVAITRALAPSRDTVLSRDALKKAVYVGQLDKKFLVVSMDGILVAVDQHAASERIRVERFLRGLENVERKDVRIAVRMEGREMNALNRWKAEFERWGFKVDVGNEGGVCTVTSVPKMVTDRFSSPESAKALIKDHLLALEESRPLPPAPAGSTVLRLSAGAPRLLLDAIASRACRSAIMFGDLLDKKEASALLMELGGCELPFQCAHGRPSMVPLARIGEEKDGANCRD